MAAKKKSQASNPVRTPDRIEPRIVRVRGQRVVLDADLAHLYGVTTRAFNQAFKRNAERFPDDFAFQINGRRIRRFEITICDIKISTH